MNEGMRRWAKKGVVVGVAATVAVGFAGCSKDDDSAGGNIKVMVTGQFDAQPFAFPETRDVIKMVIDGANASGGINGKQIEVIECNDGNDPNKASSCARQAVSEKAAVVLSPFTNHASTSIPVLEAAKVAFLTPDALSPEVLQSPISFPLNGGSPANFGSIGTNMVEQQCKKPSSISFEQGSATFSIKSINAGLTTNGAPEMSNGVSVGSGVPDYAPSVATLKSKGADCVAVVMPPADALKFGQAVVQSGEDLKLFSVGSVFSPAAIEALNGGVYVGLASDYPPLGDTANSGIQKYRTEVEAAGYKIDYFTLRSWTAANVLLDVLKRVDGDVTAESMLDAFNNASDVNVGTLPTLNFTKPIGVPGYDRVVNPMVNLLHNDGPKVVLSQPEPVDATPILKALSTS